MQASDILGYDLLKVCNEGEPLTIPVQLAQPASCAEGKVWQALKTDDTAELPQGRRKSWTPLSSASQPSM